MDKISTKQSGLSTGLAILGLVLGIVALLAAFVPVLGSLAFLLGVPAAIVSILALLIALSRNTTTGLCIGAVLVCLVANGISWWQYYAIKEMGQKSRESMERMLRKSEKSPSIESVPADAKAASVRKERVNEVRNKDLDEIKALLQTRRSYAAFDKCKTLLEGKPTQDTIDAIARLTGEESYTIKLLGKDFFKGRLCFSKDDKSVYCATDTCNSKRASLYKVDYVSKTLTQIATNLYTAGVCDMSALDETHISVVWCNCSGFNWYVIPSLDTQLEQPYNEELILQKSIQLPGMDQYAGNASKYPGDNDIVIYNTAQFPEAGYCYHLRVTEHGKNIFHFAARTDLLRLAGLGSQEGFGHCVSPVFSSDGSKIAFVLNTRSKNLTSSAYGTPVITDFDGKNPQLLATNISWATEPHFSPDGTKIVMAVRNDENRRRVWNNEISASSIILADVKSKDARRVTTDDNYEYSYPTFSHDGKKLAYISRMHWAWGYLNIKYLDRHYTAEELLARFNRIELKQRAMFDLMGSIVQAQRSYKQQHGKYAGSIATLVEAQLLPPDVIKDDTCYDFKISVKAELFSYNVSATPVSLELSGNSTFSIDESNVKIHVGRDSFDLGCAIRLPPTDDYSAY